jgi:molybdenum cofactor biosynthesis protein B
MGTREHKKQSPRELRVGIVSVSTTRTLKDDKSGHWIRKTATREGHRIVCHKVIPDDIEIILETIREAIHELSPQALIFTGGTGISETDVTIEAVRPLFEKELAAFGVIFSQLSFEEIDSAAILSRTTAGIVDGTVIFCIPGSLKACKLACKALIFPELGHIVKHLQEG